MTATVEQDDTPNDDFRVCLVTGHRHRGAAAICDEHLDELGSLVDGVARMTRDLGYHLVPGSGPAGEKVTTSRTGSPTPARLDVLSLVGPGVTEIRRDARSLAVQVRRFSRVSMYDVTFVRAGKTVTERRELRTWHAELLTDGVAPASNCACGKPHDDDARPSDTPTGRPIHRLIDDQIGAVPPAEWLDTWVRRFRVALQQPPRPLPPGTWVDYTEPDQGKRLTRVGLGEWWRMTHGRPSIMRAVAAFLTLRVAYADAVGRAVLGLTTDGPERQVRAEDALAGKRPPVLAYDTTTAEWILRYGAAKTAAAVEVDAHYVKQWLPMVVAVNDDADTLELATFATELRALHRELESTLGLTRDDQWIGRCPAKLVDPRTGDETARLCGAGIWHDAHRSDTAPITCPRCQTRWPVTEWLALRAKIRHDWPIDVRVRYTKVDRAYAESVVERLPKCRGCEVTMSVRWVRDYRRGDRAAMYRPAGYFCPNRCLAGGTATEDAA